MNLAGIIEARCDQSHAVPTDALFAASLCAIDPQGLGGMILRGADRPRDTVVQALIAALPAGAPVRRMSRNVDEDRLLGGLDVTATLGAGEMHHRDGLLAESNGGLLVAAAAERLSAATAAHLGAALDCGSVTVERDGLNFAIATQFIMVALDDATEEQVPPGLVERLAFHIDLDEQPPEMEKAPPDDKPITAEAAIETLSATGIALGVGSLRASLFALRTARAAARYAGRDALIGQDVLDAARLVLAPRATRLPAPADESSAPPSPPADPSDKERDGGGPFEDRVIAATAAALPADVIARLGQGALTAGVGSRGRGAGERRRALTRGRPAGIRAGIPGGGRRLALVGTLSAAAPWQKLRGRTDRVIVRKDDLRVLRFEARAELVTIMAVDASGSAAMARLAEAKGAVELLLAQAYILRAEVALIAFRGTAAELLLPPTRSLTRARRVLAELPGGGGTPLASGLVAARDLALAARARGRTPFLVLLSDGRGNIAIDGSPGRPAAERDALAAARAIAQDRISAVVIDTAPRADPRAAALADSMAARCMTLPYAGASGIEAAVSVLARGAR